ncbi:hypothetical protein Pcinc_018000 [Petrolisthes cinctipes]|uniref:Uncharacterized protein n=1 Tax=Petrolisthes cinctipes TaxID=88211 RepID=A0AAE1FPI6_PETCI|nr:hypothetical protein Pcinc_018000 [Petrolisthes cinctipes]
MQVTHGNFTPTAHLYSKYSSDKRLIFGGMAGLIDHLGTVSGASPCAENISMENDGNSSHHDSETESAFSGFSSDDEDGSLKTRKLKEYRMKNKRRRRMRKGVKKMPIQTNCEYPREEKSTYPCLQPQRLSAMLEEHSYAVPTSHRDEVSSHAVPMDNEQTSTTEVDHGGVIWKSNDHQTRSMCDKPENRGESIILCEDNDYSSGCALSSCNCIITLTETPDHSMFKGPPGTSSAQVSALQKVAAVSNTSFTPSKDVETNNNYICHSLKDTSKADNEEMSAYVAPECEAHVSSSVNFGDTEDVCKTVFVKLRRLDDQYINDMKASNSESKLTNNMKFSKSVDECTSATNFSKSVEECTSATNFSKSVEECTSATNFSKSVEECTSDTNFSKSVEECTSDTNFSKSVEECTSDTNFSKSVEECTSDTNFSKSVEECTSDTNFSKSVEECTSDTNFSKSVEECTSDTNFSKSVEECTSDTNFSKSVEECTSESECTRDTSQKKIDDDGDEEIFAVAAPSLKPNQLHIDSDRENSPGIEMREMGLLKNENMDAVYKPQGSTEATQNEKYPSFSVYLGAYYPDMNLPVEGLDRNLIQRITKPPEVRVVCARNNTDEVVIRTAWCALVSQCPEGAHNSMLLSPGANTRNKMHRKGISEENSRHTTGKKSKFPITVGGNKFKPENYNSCAKSTSEYKLHHCHNQQNVHIYNEAITLSSQVDGSSCVANSTSASVIANNNVAKLASPVVVHSDTKSSLASLILVHKEVSVKEHVHAKDMSVILDVKKDISTKSNTDDVHIIRNAFSRIIPNVKPHNTSSSTDITNSKGTASFQCFCKFNSAIYKDRESYCCGMNNTSGCCGFAKAVKTCALGGFNYPTNRAAFFSLLGLMKKEEYDKEVYAQSLIVHKTRKVCANRVKDSDTNKLQLDAFDTPVINTNDTGNFGAQKTCSHLQLQSEYWKTTTGRSKPLNLNSEKSIVGCIKPLTLNSVKTTMGCSQPLQPLRSGCEKATADCSKPLNLNGEKAIAGCSTPLYLIGEKTVAGCSKSLNFNGEKTFDCSKPLQSDSEKVAVNCSKPLQSDSINIVADCCKPLQSDSMKVAGDCNKPLKKTAADCSKPHKSDSKNVTADCSKPVQLHSEKAAVNTKPLLRDNKKVAVDCSKPLQLDSKEVAVDSNKPIISNNEVAFDCNKPLQLDRNMTAVDCNMPVKSDKKAVAVDSNKPLLSENKEVTVDCNKPILALPDRMNLRNSSKVLKKPSCPCCADDTLNNNLFVGKSATCTKPKREMIPEESIICAVCPKYSIDMSKLNPKSDTNSRFYNTNHICPHSKVNKQRKEIKSISLVPVTGIQIPSRIKPSGPEDRCVNNTIRPTEANDKCRDDINSRSIQNEYTNNFMLCREAEEKYKHIIKDCSVNICPVDGNCENDNNCSKYSEKLSPLKLWSSGSPVQDVTRDASGHTPRTSPHKSRSIQNSCSPVHNVIRDAIKYTPSSTSPPRSSRRETKTPQKRVTLCPSMEIEDIQTRLPGLATKSVLCNDFEFVGFNNGAEKSAAKRHSLPSQCQMNRCSKRIKFMKSPFTPKTAEEHEKLPYSSLPSTPVAIKEHKTLPNGSLPSSPTTSKYEGKLSNPASSCVVSILEHCNCLRYESSLRRHSNLKHPEITGNKARMMRCDKD